MYLKFNNFINFNHSHTGENKKILQIFNFKITGFMIG